MLYPQIRLLLASFRINIDFVLRNRTQLVQIYVVLLTIFLEGLERKNLDKNKWKIPFQKANI